MKLYDLNNSLYVLNEEMYDAIRDFMGQGMSRAEATREAAKMYPEEAHGDSGNYRGRGRYSKKSYPKKSSSTSTTKPKLSLRYYNVRKSDEAEAKKMGLTNKNNKWFINNNASGAKEKVIEADKKFGKGRDWSPK